MLNTTNIKILVILTFLISNDPGNIPYNQALKNQPNIDNPMDFVAFCVHKWLL
jgi:hypothetical protein